MTSREFNQDTSRAKRAAEDGPVFITQRGRLSHVLLKIDDYERLSGQGTTIVDRLAMPDSVDIDFEPGRLGSVTREARLE